MRALILVAILGLIGCATLTSSECKRYVAVAKLAVGECMRLPDPADAGTCTAAANAARRGFMRCASMAPSAMSSLAATITSGGASMPARPDSVTLRPLSRAKKAVSSNTNGYLSACGSSTL